MRNAYNEQLQTLHREMTEMGAMCETAVSLAVQAVTLGESSLAEQVYEVDSGIDKKERDIESLCLKLLLQQQPVATDLRVISSALKMISDLERIGDQASDIAELVPYVHLEEGTGLHIGDMARAVIRMVTDSVDSFVKRDLDLARAVYAADDKVDALFDQVKQELIGMIAKDASRGEQCMDLLMVAKYLERIGDHATNVAEWVEYSITNVHPDKN